MPDFSIITQTPEVRGIVQQNILERAFHDGLFPNLLYRADVEPILWAGNVGDTQLFTGVGLITPDLQPVVPGQDITTASFQKEQWSAQLQQYGKSIDSFMPNNYVAIANLFYRNSHQLGLHSGQVLNRLVRNAQFRAALSGSTVADGAQNPVNTIRVGRLNGLTRARRPDLPAGSAVTFDFVSVANPLPVSIAATGGTVTRNITAFAADTPGDELGPGTITVDGAALNVPDRAAVIATDATKIIRVGGGTTVDGISSANTLTLKDIRSAVARLRTQNVPRHPDGWYHAHIDPISEAQVFSDSEFNRLMTALPDYYVYRDFALGYLLNTVFFRNTESPQPETVAGAPTAFAAPSGTFSKQDPFVGELFNSSGVKIHRVLFSGQGGIKEYYVDLNALITEAGVTGKVGNAVITNNSIEINTDRIQLIIRAPLNRAQDQVATTWKFIGDWPVRTDAATGDTARFKRWATIEHGE
jgi:hypothetical protein